MRDRAAFAMIVGGGMMAAYAEAWLLFSASIIILITWGALVDSRED